LTPIWATPQLDALGSTQREIVREGRALVARAKRSSPGFPGLVGYLNLRGTVAVRLSNKSRFSALYVWERHSPTLLWVLSSGTDVNGCEAAADLAGDVALEDTEQHTGTCTRGRSCPSAVDNSVTRRSNGRSKIEVSRDVFWTGLEIVRLFYSGPRKAPGQSVSSRECSFERGDIQRG
jgi:hypothetical protein